jgi:NADH dehydrogenase (ubiquinone) Fe-S protein 3
VYKKYTLPLSIFVVFENINPVVWTSESFYPNSYTMYINKSWFYSLNIFFRNEVFFSNSMLIENSAIDNKKTFEFLKKIDFFSKNRLLLFYVYYFMSLKCKLMLLTTYNNNNLSKINSVDKLFKSAGWLERETGEMFRVSYSLKTDTRRLLLDYSKQENPLLKDYPTEGFNDVFYNFFEDQVVYNNSTVVEL